MAEGGQSNQVPTDPATTLKNLVKKRGNLRSYITRIINNVKSEVEHATPNDHAIYDYLVQLRPRERQLLAYDEAIGDILEGADYEREADAAYDYHSNFVLIMDKAERRLARAGHPTNATSTPSGGSSTTSNSGSNTSSSSGSSNSGGTTQGQSVRLPKLEIKKFSGNISDWQQFWSHFEGSIHLSSLNKTDKFHYLNSYLEGQAAKTIAGLAVTEANYDSAITILEERYGRKDIIVSAHLNNFFKLTAIKNASDINNLRNLYDTCEIEIRSLKSLGVDSKSYDSLLGHLVFGLLPTEITLSFSRENKGQIDISVIKLLTFLKEEIACRERAYNVSRTEPERKTHAHEKQSNFSRHDNRSQKANLPSAAALNIGVKERVCIFCDNPAHGPMECNKFTISQRREIALKKRCCFICLKTNHQAKRCNLRTRRVCKICGQSHHMALCDSDDAKNKEASLLQNETKTDIKGQTESTRNVGVQMSSVAEKGAVLLQTALALAANQENGKAARVRCLLDAGAHRTFIKEEVSRELRLPVIGEEELDVYVFEEKRPIKVKRKRVQLEIRSLHDPNKRVVIQALETPAITGAVFSVPNDGIVREMGDRGLPMADAPVINGIENVTSQLDLLIGTEFYWKISTGKIERLSETLVLLETVFGWVAHGATAVEYSQASMNTVTVMQAICEDQTLSDQVRAFWELDSIGILDNQNELEDKTQTLAEFEDNISFRNGRYEVAFPWKPNHDRLGDNYTIAAKRTENLLRKLRANPELLKQYDNIIQEQLQSGIIEEATDITGTPVYYLPHHGVTRESETTKLRIVQDGSSHAEGIPSLNDCLETGLNLNPELLEVLIRFRENQVAFIGDIEKAFLQIAIAEKDRDALRFLWVDISEPSNRFKTYRMTRVPFGITTSPYLLAATVRHHLKGYEPTEPAICDLIDKSLYVDDLTSGARTAPEAFEITTRSAEIMREAGMNLRKWRTNSPDLRKLWGKTEAPPTSDQVKVLGVPWSTVKDTFLFEVQALLKFLVGRKSTKRWVLKAVARIFDPLGLVSPFTVRAKFLFQGLWEKGLKWDERLPPDMAAQFDSWCEELAELNRIEVPRYYFAGTDDSESVKTELHTFVDASEKAYAAVTYLRYQTSEKTILTTLVASKARLAPLKRLTLPRLELTGALLGVRLADTILKTLTVPPIRVFFWTDSQIALQWIRSSALQWKPFVSNRVREIQSKSDPQTWFHCRGKHNPADLPTRGRTITDLESNSLWWHGPSWLSQSQLSPPQIESRELKSEETQELRATFNNPIAQGMTLAQPSTEAPFDIAKFSSLTKLYRITAWFNRFIKNARTKDNRSSGELSAEEMSRAEIFWVLQAQKEGFPDEISKLSQDEKISTNSKIATLHPKLDDNGLLCVGGRLSNAELSYQEKHPWILSSSHRLAELVAHFNHVRVMHGGVNESLVQVREKFWIIKGRQLVKRVVNQCCACRKFLAKPSATVMAPLPHARSNPAPPFAVTGLDFAGPLYNKDGSKCYIALFTCATTRCIHLELVSDMTSGNFLLAFRRFVARRGIVQKIFSDNAKTFKKAEAELKQLLKSLLNPEVTRYFGELQISWYYIADRAAWWGGFWERLVRSVKNALRKTLGQAKLTHEELETALAEAEAAINSRPISFIYQDAGEPIPLSPSHFLVGVRLSALPSRSYTKDEGQHANQADLTKRWKYRQQLNERFWQRWKSDYLLELRSAHHRTKCVPTKTIQQNDVVLIEEPRVPRLCWKTAIVEETFKGRDGFTRSCMLRLANGTRLRRPIQLIYLLESTLTS